jgi:type IV pilus assembly protein PilW
VMIAVGIGLLLVAGALTVFMSNRQTYIATENLGRIQEAARVSFELMGRDLRVAGSNPCAGNVVQRNVLVNAGTAWWSPPNPVTTPPPDAGSTFLSGFDGDTAMTGLSFGTAMQQRVAGTGGFQAIAAMPTGVQVALHNPTTATFTLNSNAHGLTAGDIAMVCDFEQAAIFKVSSVSGTQIRHNVVSTGPTDNSRVRLVDPTQDYRFGCFRGLFNASGCREPDPADLTPRQWPAFISRLQPTRWYVGNNARGGRSLYRAAVITQGGVPTEQVLEVANNVQDLQVAYRVGNAYVPAATVTDWSNVNAVRFTLTLTSTDAIGTDNGGSPLARVFQHTVALRSRLQ